MNGLVEQRRRELQSALEAAEVTAQRAQLASEAIPPLTNRLAELRGLLAEIQREAALMSPAWSPEQAGALVVHRLGLTALIETAERQIAQHRAVEGEAVKAAERVRAAKLSLEHEEKRERERQTQQRRKEIEQELAREEWARRDRGREAAKYMREREAERSAREAAARSQGNG